MTSSKVPNKGGPPHGDTPVRSPISAAPIDLLDGLATTFLEASSDCVKLIDRTGIIRYVNRAGCALMEVDGPNAILERRWTELWPQATWPAIEQAIAGALGGEVVRFSDACPTAKGTSKWWDVILSPVAGHGGTIDHLLWVSRDVTSQKMVEVSLKASEQRFRALAENMAQFAWMAYPSGYVFWHNQRWFDYTGVGPVDAAGEGWREVIHPDFSERVVRQLMRAFESGETWEDTFPMRAADGGYRWFLSRAMPLHSSISF
jgi:PAS domain S-box-containing protein